MATKLHGLINLSKIDKDLIITNARGEKCIWVDILENLNGADQYGNTHSLSQYNGQTRTKTYLGNFKPQEFGPAAPAASTIPGAPEPLDDDKNDLPF